MQAAASLRAAREAEVLGTAEESAQSAAQAARLRRALAFEEPFSNFTSSGELAPEVVANSKVLISGERLNNVALRKALTADGSNLADWAKWESATSGSPLGDFKIHFYYNKVTRKFNYDFDYKVKLNDPGQPQIPVPQFLDMLRKLMNSSP
jgi:hypothetical protein